MENLWDSSRTFTDPIDECVYGSRLIGGDPSLVLHGGGNTSVKADWLDITGEVIEALHVKGSGWDLASIEAPGFTPLPLDRLRRLAALDQLSDPDMMAALAAARLDASFPQPSVETLLHALIPHAAVQHSHADVIVTVTNLADGEERVREIFGTEVVVVPYVMPGFDLAQVVARLWPQQAADDTPGMVLMNHGLFTFGATTRVAYERHVELITRAETWLAENAPVPELSGPSDPVDPLALARLRSDLSAAAGFPLIACRHCQAPVTGFVRRPDLPSLARRGPLTPDHVIRTKRLPMVGTDVDGYVAEYREFYRRNEHRGRTELSMLDPAPRVVLDPALGMVTAGRTAADAAIAADIYHHTIPVLARSEDHLGGYQALPEEDLFDVEYWDLEQAKLRRGGSPPPMAGQVALVTGAASGIGRACAAELLGRGAAVVGLDRAPDVVDGFDHQAWLGIEADVTDESSVRAALRAGVERFGGFDLAVVAAGIFGATRPLAQFDLAEWRQVQAVNVDAVALLFHHLHPYLVLSPAAPSVAVIGSKNVPAPGKGAAAYSASKAALTQLVRVAALEWAEDGIRVNAVHPDAVFDTGLWSPELLAERAAKYGLTVEQYKRRNLLGTEITSASVAVTVVDLLSPRFGATTGAQLPIDGGSDRVV